MKRVALTGITSFGLAVAAIVVVSVGVAIWPGAMKLTAPVLCPAEQPDPFVVRTTTSGTSGAGNSTSFSLFCMGERGDFTEVGTWEPYGLLFLSTWGLFAALALLLVVQGSWHRRRRNRVTGGPDVGSPVEAGPTSPIS